MLGIEWKENTQAREPDRLVTFTSSPLPAAASLPSLPPHPKDHTTILLQAFSPMPSSSTNPTYSGHSLRTMRPSLPKKQGGQWSRWASSDLHSQKRIDDFHIHKLINIIHNIKQPERQTWLTILIKCIKELWQNPTPFHYKSPIVVRDKRKHTHQRKAV